MDIRSLRDRVEYVLVRNEEARRSDKACAYFVWTTFYYDRLERDACGHLTVRIGAAIFDLPSLQRIATIKRDFQLEGKYLSPDCPMPRARRQARVRGHEPWYMKT